MNTSKFTAPLIITLILLIGCEKANPSKSETVSSSKSTTTNLPSLVCEVKNPVEDLPWLKKMEELISKDKVDWGFEVYAVPYKGETILWVFSAIYSSYPIFYYCNGKRVDFPINPSTDPDALALTKLIESPAICANKIYRSSGASKRCQ